MVPGPAIAAPLGNQLAVQILRLHPRSMESETLGVSLSLQVILMYSHLRNTVLDNHFQDVVNTTIDRFTKYFAYSITKYLNLYSALQITKHFQRHSSHLISQYYYEMDWGGTHIFILQH